ncbi:MAG TPA: hypothetical protein VJ654_14130 [Noviherbaspirillum sp.]|nr:hypothetical protein [Noviherbaspirillum sp.]
MQIEEFLAAKRKMEEAIRDAIVRATCEFWAETGYTPRTIGVDLLRHQAIGQSRTQYVIDRVSTEVEL